MKPVKLFVVGLVGLFLLFGIVACKTEGTVSSDSATYSLSGMLTRMGVADGIIAYVKLVASGGAETDSALYFAVSTGFLGDTASYSISGIEAGDYTGYAFIDVNGTASGNPDSMPDSGDWVTDGGGNITISSDTIFDLTHDDWIVF